MTTEVERLEHALYEARHKAEEWEESHDIELARAEAAEARVRELTDQVAALETVLKEHLPKCAACAALATRRYAHCAGYEAYACDNDKCLEEHYCDVCGQVWYSDGDGLGCQGYHEGGRCTGKTKHPETSHVFQLRDVAHAAVPRPPGDGSGRTCRENFPKHSVWLWSPVYEVMHPDDIWRMTHPIYSLLGVGGWRNRRLKEPHETERATPETINNDLGFRVYRNYFEIRRYAAE